MYVCVNASSGESRSRAWRRLPLEVRGLLAAGVPPARGAYRQHGHQLHQVGRIGHRHRHPGHAARRPHITHRPVRHTVGLTSHITPWCMPWSRAFPARFAARTRPSSPAVSTAAPAGWRPGLAPRLHTCRTCGQLLRHAGRTRSTGARYRVGCGSRRTRLTLVGGPLSPVPACGMLVFHAQAHLRLTPATVHHSAIANGLLGLPLKRARAISRVARQAHNVDFAARPVHLNGRNGCVGPPRVANAHGRCR
jgi:hypothetical protein